ncbi:hypothetical protein FO519_006611 [Halicephalobus sp. NKZ332]|nr:hypothetical protein FO519_006611 [Halicephalobus sp. NKZ332]
MTLAKAGVMEVPEHIYVNGRNPGRNSAEFLAKEAAMIERGMRMPDQIVYEGNRASRGDDVYDVNNQMRVPETLTIHDLQMEDTVGRSDSHASDNSIAVDENPLRELKIMRRQLARLATRMTVMEEANARRGTRETGLWLTTFGAIIAAAFFLLRKRITGF